MKRNFPNFLEAYFEYAKDNYCPDDFHIWTGLSLIGAALERKVSLKQGKIEHFPNIYTLLVSHPGVGKSTALDRGVDLLEQLKAVHNTELKIIPNQITEPALIEAMKIRAQMDVRGKIIYHSSGYFYASEASASALQNLHGDFNATITAFYDCPKVFRKSIKSDGHSEIPNLCMNVLAGATFDYLKELVNERSVMGGLASRFIYVINKDRIVRKTKWGEEKELDIKTRNLLVEDLATINKLVGPFQPTPGFIFQWEQWKPKFDQFLIDLKSPRLESINARKGTNLLKLCMLLSVAESNELKLTTDHWERALGLIEQVTKENAYVVESAIMSNIEGQAGINQTILRSLGNIGEKIPVKVLKKRIVKAGIESSRVDATIQKLREAGMLGYVTSNGQDLVELLVDPNTNL